MTIQPTHHGPSSTPQPDPAKHSSYAKLPVSPKGPPEASDINKHTIKPSIPSGFLNKIKSAWQQIFHHTKPSDYSKLPSGTQTTNYGVAPSVSSAGNPYDQIDIAQSEAGYGHLSLLPDDEEMEIDSPNYAPIPLPGDVQTHSPNYAPIPLPSNYGALPKTHETNYGVMPEGFQEPKPSASRPYDKVGPLTDKAVDDVLLELNAANYGALPQTSEPRYGMLPTPRTLYDRVPHSPDNGDSSNYDSFNPLVMIQAFIDQEPPKDAGELKEWKDTLKLYTEHLEQITDKITEPAAKEQHTALLAALREKLVP